ncbi:hypothetical protein LCGC14_0885350 [marine sediment metagenome]|uniref:Uncharacterized protein n=1 Tax=marine sediment metagenome TaxID=412755 RepID=A0A0F9P0S5_9ZZZZ
MQAILEDTQETEDLEPIKLGNLAIYRTPAELQTKVDEYFESGVHIRTVIVGKKGDKKKIEVKLPTVVGLALYLGFNSRQSIYDYNARDGFSYVIKRAVSFIEMYHEEALGDGNNVVGSIFWLKNHGWKDKSEVEHTAKESIAALIQAAQQAKQIESKVVKSLPVIPLSQEPAIIERKDDV